MNNAKPIITEERKLAVRLAFEKDMYHLATRYKQYVDHMQRKYMCVTRNKILQRTKETICKVD